MSTSDGVPPLIALVERLQRAMVSDLVTAAARRGFPEVRASHNAAFATLRTEGSRVSDMAARAGMTKQSMAAIVKDLEAAGLVTIGPDPSDGRAKLVTYTARGLECARGGGAYLREVEDLLADAVGSERLEQVRNVLVRTATLLEDRSAADRT